MIIRILENKTPELVFDDMSPEQADIFNQILKSENFYTIVNAGRRSGKTYICSRLAVAYALLLNKTENILVAAPYQDQSDTFFQTILDIPNVDYFIQDVKYSDHKRITFKTGVWIDFRTLNKEDAIRSKGYKILFIDEFSFLKPKVFSKTVAPLIASSGKNARMILLSTPNGVGNEFHDFALRGMSDDPQYSQYSYFHFIYTINPKHNEAFILEEKERIHKNTFRQEYLGEFIESGGDVFEYLEFACVLESYRQPEHPNNAYYAGFDFGVKGDCSVLCILDKHRDVVHISEYSGAEPEQIKQMGEVLKKYKPICYAESNGIGSGFISHLKLIYPHIISKTTTNDSKIQIIQDLKDVLFLSTIKLPTVKLCPKLHKELSNYTMSRTEKTNKIAFHHRPGENDDYVMALAYANNCYNDKRTGFNAIIKPRTTFHK